MGDEEQGWEERGVGNVRLSCLWEMDRLKSKWVEKGKEMGE